MEFYEFFFDLIVFYLLRGVKEIKSKVIVSRGLNSTCLDLIP